MIIALDNRIFINGELFCTVNIEGAEDPEKLIDWIMAMAMVWEEDISQDLP